MRTSHVSLNNYIWIPKRLAVLLRFVQNIGVFESLPFGVGNEQGTYLQKGRC
jgi:hypothetical protein